MKNLPFDKPGRFWRGNIHSHSNRSDGVYEPEKVCNLYRQAGYDFLALTDHFMERYNFPIVDTRPMRSPDFTTLIGAELHAEATELGGIWHILAVGLPLDFPPTGSDESGPALAARALDAGAYVAAAHPQWYTVTEADILSLGPIHGIEVYNGVTVDDNDRYDSWYIMDVLLSRGHRYLAYAADDFHGSPRRHDLQRGWMWVKSKSLEPESLLVALKSGHYYSSTGPQLYDVEIQEGQQATIHCSPVDRVYVTGKGASVQSAYGHGFTEAVLDLSRFASPYCRVTVRDAFGGRAWTNPIWL